MKKWSTRRVVVCLNNDGYATSLEKRKLHVMLRDAAAEKRGLVRIIERTG
jgi:hypothetical protein